MKKLFVIIYGLLTMTSSWSQTVISFTTTEQVQWAKSKGSLSSKKEGKVVAEIDAQMKGIEFSAFGTTFNELDWDAFNMLNRNEQDEVMYNLFSPEGDLKFTHGRVSMNANDYARAVVFLPEGHVFKRTFANRFQFLYGSHIGSAPPFISSMRCCISFLAAAAKAGVLSLYGVVSVAKAKALPSAAYSKVKSVSGFAAISAAIVSAMLPSGARSMPDMI